jgi:ribosomal protein S16
MFCPLSQAGQLQIRTIVPHWQVGSRLPSQTTPRLIVDRTVIILRGSNLSGEGYRHGDPASARPTAIPFRIFWPAMSATPETSRIKQEFCMVVMRMKRMGRTHRPFYRINVMDKRAPRDGRVIEELGWYDPVAPEDRQVSLNVERVDYWLSVGAQPSDTVRSLLRKNGCDPTSGKKLDQPTAK